MPRIVIGTGAAPATPAAGTVVLYAKTDGQIYAKDENGVETQLGNIASVAGGASGIGFPGADGEDGGVQFVTFPDFLILPGDITGKSHRDGGGDVRRLPQFSYSANHTTTLNEANSHLLHPSADTTARTFTIDSNANVPYDIGTMLTFVNQNGAGTLTIAITTDTMRLAGAGTTGSRTLTANGIATALKITTTEWIISGTNLT